MKKKKRVLCVCSQGVNRSKYLAEYLREKGYSTRYGGIVFFALNKLKKSDVDWADIIIFMRKHHKLLFNLKFSKKGKKIISLEIIDNPAKFFFEYPEIVNMDYWEIQKKITYPEIRRQIDKYLPL